MDGQNFQNGQNTQNSTNVLAIISLICGIFAILLGCCTGWFGFIFGIAGIVCAVLANKQGNTGVATAGLICSIIAIVISLLIVILAVIGIGLMESAGIYY